MRFETRGTTVLITGGGGGLGREYARQAIADGARRVVLWDVDAAALDAAAQDLARPAVTISTYVVDVTDLPAVTAAAEQVLREAGPVDVIVNNAGVVRGGYFWEQDSARDVSLTMNVNALAPMLVTRAFLDEMLANSDRPRRLLTVASAAAVVSNPRLAVYAASKWAALAWSDSLRLELQQAGHHHIQVTTFCPTYIDTGMFAGAGGMLWTRTLRPHEAVAASWKAMRAGRPVLFQPWTVQLGRVLRGILPVRAWDAAAGSFLGVYHSMDHFTGRPSDGRRAAADSGPDQRANPRDAQDAGRLAEPDRIADRD